MAAAGDSLGRRVGRATLAVIVGLLIGLIPANLWPILLFALGPLLAAVVELAFLGLYLWWVSGGGPPLGWKPARREAMRVRSLTGRQWLWGLVAAVSFAATIHAAIVLLFRLVQFPVEEFRRGYSALFSAVPLPWLVVVSLGAVRGGL